MRLHRGSLLILSLVTSVAARAGTECDRALAPALPLDIPARLDPAQRAPQVAGRMVTLLRQSPDVLGANNAMILLNGEIRPTLDVVANFLQSSQNYGGSPLSVPALRFAQSLYEDLTRRLDLFAAAREPTATKPSRWSWTQMRYASEGEPRDQQVLKVRYLYFVINQAARTLSDQVKVWAAATEQVATLRDRMRAAASLVADVCDRIDVETDDWTFKLRLQSLLESVREQGTFLEAMHLKMVQNIQMANGSLDAIGDLVTRRIPLEAVLAVPALDLSPLEPPELKARPAAVAGPSADDLSTAMAEIMRAAQNMTDFGAAREVLLQFVTKNHQALSVDQAIRLAKCITNSALTVNQVLLRFVNLRQGTLTQTDLGRLANESLDDVTRKAIIKHISAAGPIGPGGRVSP